MCSQIRIHRSGWCDRIDRINHNESALSGRQIECACICRECNRRIPNDGIEKLQLHIQSQFAIVDAIEQHPLEIRIGGGHHEIVGETLNVGGVVEHGLGLTHSRVFASVSQCGHPVAV